MVRRKNVEVESINFGVVECGDGCGELEVVTVMVMLV